MASWFTRALDRVTPWDRGGEVQRRQIAAKKKREEEEAQNQAPGLRVTNNQPTQRVVVDTPLPKPQQPQNLFEDLNKAITLPGANNRVPIFNDSLETPKQPAPGTVIKPTLKVTPTVNNRDIILPDGRRSSEVPDSPETILNRELDRGRSFEDIARENNFNLDKVREYANLTRPNYGIKIERPKQGNWNKIRDVFDANTEADKFRRQEGNKVALSEGRYGDEKPLTLVNPGNIVGRTPVVGHIAKGLNTLGAQGAELIPTIEGQVYDKMYSDLSKEWVEATKRGDKFTAQEAQRKMDLMWPLLEENRNQQDAAHTMFEKNKGGLFNTGTLYGEEASRRGSKEDALKDIALPTAVAMLDLYTLGRGSAVSEGLKTGGTAALRTQAPNIAKMAIGNYASGDLGARAEGATGWDPVVAGSTNAVLGTVPDVGLPLAARGFKNRIIPSFLRRGSVNPAEVVNDLDEGAISASAESASQALRSRNIPVKFAEDIPVSAIDGLPENIRVRNLNEPGRLIQEVTGDATTATPDALVQRLAEDARIQRTADAAFDQAKTAPKPNPAIEGIKPSEPSRPFSLTPEAIKSAQDDLIDEYATMLRDLGEGNGTQLVPDGEGGYFRTSNNVRTAETAGKKMSKAAWREEAERQLRAGNAEPGVQKAFNDAADPEVQSMLAKGEPAEVPQGSPIQVKQVSGIPVTDQTNVPVNLPETPGQVRTTTATAPSNIESAQVAANTPVVSLPPDVQEILDNPRQFNKRQVAAARNQRKLARAMAKAQEDTAEAMSRINTASPAAQSGEGFVETGQVGKSANGGGYQKVSRATELAQAVQETANMSPADVLQTARKNQAGTGGFTRRDIRNIHALLETKRVARGTPEWNELRQILKEDGTVWGQQGALRNYTMRRTASADELTSRYESKLYRLADDPTKIDSKIFDAVEEAETAYANARDEAMAAYNRFTEAPTSANAKLYHAAQDAADAADSAAKQAEYKGAKQALKGNKDIKQIRELEKMANDADLYQMDAVDASMLSGTGTFVRNFVNAGVGGVEEGLFGKIGSRLASITKKSRANGIKVGGGAGRESLVGFGEGVGNIIDTSKARARNAGWNPLEHIKNWATTGNQLGDTVIDSQVKYNVLDHYKSLLKKEGYKGAELTDRASVMARQDPENLGRMYASAARTAAGLGNGVTRGNKFETIVKNMISDTLSMGKPNRVSENTAKLITRMTVGFPTAIARSTGEGVKRFTLGAPTFIKALRTADPMERALLIKEGVKQAGTGAAVIPPLFYAMGANGLITGAYPKDNPEEQARWEREGISENSIKIGGNYYQLPGYLGAWAVPSIFWASMGRNDGDWGAAAADTAKSVPDILPVDQPQKIFDVINGRADLGEYMAQTGASAVRATTPGGALFAELAKMFDPTKNETNEGSNLENFVDKVLTGIPGASNTVPNKVDDAGNEIQNPNPVPLTLGATSAVQGQGEERTAQIQANVDSNVQALTDMGVFDDANLQEVLDDKEKQIYNKLKTGKKLGEGDLKKLQDAFVKGVSSTGEDTAYLEKGQYDTNLSVLRLKKKLMEDDKSTKPSDLKKLETAIKRGEVYKENEIPYDLIQAYQSTGVDEWRKMGIPPTDDDYDPDYYDPEMYQKLWDIDTQLTKAGVSYRKGMLDKQKYYDKDKKGAGGRSGSGQRSIDTSFGTLKEGKFAPNVQQYETIDARSGSIPYIRTVRPNIVHKITASR